MSLPYFNMYPTDFEAKTSHLTLEEDGAYNRLLRLMWMTPGCSLPDDDKWIKRRMRVDQDTFNRVVLVILDEFFERKNGRVSNARLAREYAKSNDAHKKRVSAGKLGGKAKALKTTNNRPSNAKAKPYQPEPEPEPIKRDTNVSPKKPEKLRIPDGWIPSPDEYDYAKIKHKLHPDDIEEMIDDFQGYWADRTDAGGKKTKRGWSLCWKNHVRRNAAQFIRNRGMAGKTFSSGFGQGSSIASTVARRNAERQN